jgi:hypothetical protein
MMGTPVVEPIEEERGCSLVRTARDDGCSLRQVAREEASLGGFL